MHFDDRLATVLQHRAAGERAARVQFRQLLDLLGMPTERAETGLTRAAYRRLDALSLMIPAAQRERIVAECSARIRNTRLIAALAGAEPAVAMAALARAGLTDAQWITLIPELPVRARGLLRHRRNLPEAAESLLEKLGVFDRALPEPATSSPIDVTHERDEGVEDTPRPASGAESAALELGRFPVEDYVLSPGHETANTREPGPIPGQSDLAALVKRIEDFQRARVRRLDAGASDAPRLPLAGEEPPDEKVEAPRTVLVTTDPAGKIDWAAAPFGPLLVGIPLAGERSAGQAIATAMRNRRAIGSAPLELAGTELVAGQWVVDAAPRFAPRGGHFTGYVGRLRRPAPAPADTRALRAADRVRQLLHELRTPVTAIQGFAEVIQQQTIGPVPHEYRALAAEIAGDTARMLAGFAEIERLARLELGTLAMPSGTSDFVAILRRRVEQLQTVLSPRVARFDVRWRVEEARVPLMSDEAETLVWRFLGTIAAATAAGERIAFDLAVEGDRVRLSAQAPAALAQVEDIVAADVRPATGHLGTGLFGAGFALRLARAEARAASGDLVRAENGGLVLTLPLAEGHHPHHSPRERQSERAGL